jgi:hypothetical protein
MSTDNTDKVPEQTNKAATQEDLQYGGFTRFELELEVPEPMRCEALAQLHT